MATENDARSHDSFSKKNEELFKKHFPGGLDEQSAVLKAHLLIESMLRDFCIGSIPNPAYLQQARLSFNQISLLARSLCDLPIPNLDYVWGLVAKLNSLRNLMAHELEPDQAKMISLRDSIVKVVNDHSKNPNVSFDSLTRAVCYICGLIDALLQVTLAIKDNSIAAAMQIADMELEGSVESE